MKSLFSAWSRFSQRLAGRSRTRTNGSPGGGLRKFRRAALALQRLEDRTVPSGATLEWVRQFGTPGSRADFTSSVATDGDQYVAGYTDGAFAGQSNAGAYDAFVTRYDSSGNRLWLKQFGTSEYDLAWDIAAVGGGQLYVTGSTGGNLSGQGHAGADDAFLAKYDSSGNQLWVRQFGSLGDDVANHVATDGNGNVYISGFTFQTLPGQSSAGQRDIFIAKYDSAGNQLWLKQFGTSGADEAQGVAVDGSGQVFVTGRTNGAFPGYGNAGGNDIFLAKYDTAGNQLWVRQLGTSGDDASRGVAIGASGQVYIAGDLFLAAFPGQTNAGGRDLFVARYDLSGSQVWLKQFGTSGDDVARDVAVDGPGNVYLCGSTSGTFPGQTSAGSDDVLVTKYDDQGNQVWLKQFGSQPQPGASGAFDTGFGIAVDGSGIVYVAGYTQGGTFSGQTSFGQYDAFLAKLTQTASTIVTNTNDSGDGSLRQAILNANANPGIDQITFSIASGVQTIRPITALPTVTDAAIIDGSSQPGFAGTPLIELSGNLLSAPAHGLHILADGSTIRGLVINRFTGSSIAEIMLQSGGNHVEGNYIGTTVSGTAAFPIASGAGVWLFGVGNVVGGTAGGAGNLISGNNVGISVNTAGHRVEGNRIGTTADGTAALANNTGVQITGANNVLGGTAVGAGNLISGNISLGVSIFGVGATGNRVEGNLIGTNALGSGALGNDTGVFIGNTGGNVVGGTATGADNIISGNTSFGVRIFSATGNKVEGNRIGTTADGLAPLGNGTGVLIELASGNTIGGTVSGAGNLISGNTFPGINIFGAGATGNVIQGNFIGTNVSGTAAVKNGIGIDVGSANNVIGGTSAGAGNLISGNQVYGIQFNGAAATGNVVQGNYIGTNSAGTAPLRNSTGVRISNAPGNLVGGATPGARNLISGNGTGVYIIAPGASGNRIVGNYIGTDATGSAALGNFEGVYVEGPSNDVGGAAAGERNVISGNTGTGVVVASDATGTRVLGNYIGTNAAGSAAVGNFKGVVVTGRSTDVGGAASGEGNVISGNSDVGILLARLNGANRVRGNYVGTDATGSAAVGNLYGVQLQASGNVVGGTAAGARNVISGNRVDGVSISGAAATGNVVQGNYIGTNAAGTGALGNQNAGVYVLNAPSNTIGGTVSGAGNVISGNASNGVWVEGPTATGTLIAGNLIGLNAAGTAALGNGGEGIDIRTNNNTIGGASSAARNVISGNHQRGLVIQGGATGNVVQGNNIGTDVAGTSAVGNSFQGVVLGGSNNTVGGTFAGSGNTIAFNGADGVAVFFGTGNAIRGNAIHSNTGLGIDLNPDGVTPNDAGDTDTGANNLQNFPMLSTASNPPSGGTKIDGSLDSAPNTIYTLEFFSSPAADPTGFGEGATSLGTAQVMTDAGGHAAFAFVAGAAVATGQFVTATATDPTGNTSEFSGAVAVAPPNRPPAANAGGPYSVPEGGSVTLGGAGSDPDGDMLTYAWDLDNNGSYETAGQTVTFSAAGLDGPTSRTVGLRVTDPAGAAAFSTATVNVTNVAPTVTVTNVPTAPVPEGLRVTLGSTVTDPGPDTFTYLYEVHFPLGGVSGPVATIAYYPTRVGTQEAVLTVTDDDGGTTTSAPQTFEVYNLAPIVTPASDQAATEGTPATFSLGSFQDFGSDAPWTVTVAWGDGSAPTTFEAAFTNINLTPTQFIGTGALGTRPHTYADSGAYTVTVTVTDKFGGTDTETFQVAVANVAPTATLSNNGPVNEGSPAIVSFTNPIDPSSADLASLHYSFATSLAGLAPTYVAAGTSPSAPFTFPDNGTYTVYGRVFDKDGGSNDYQTQVTVNNVAPTATIGGAPGSSPEGTAINLTASATDPGSADTAAGFTFAWSVTKNGSPYASGSGPAFTFTPDDNGTYAVALSATDKDGDSGTDSRTITVTNVAPADVGLALSAGSLTENDSTTLSGSFRDPGTQDAHTVVINWGPGEAPTTINLAAGVLTFSAGHQYLDDNPTGTAADTYPISVTITDTDGGAGTGLILATVANAAPVVGSVTGPAAPVAAGTTVTASAGFTDVGTLDTHAAVWDWGDGTTSAGTVGSGGVTGGHAYTAAGVYTVTLTVTDDDGGAGQSVFRYAVVYDASAGFVTGGGWINSPAGAYAANPALTGRANFGFVAKYQHGANVPTGQTEFQFQLAGFNFKSTAYDWLVVSGAKARYRGTGTVNGAGDYAFELTAWDGQGPGGGGVDRFRIRIWDRSHGNAVVYDNQLGADDGADPTTVLAGGSIVIHD